MKQDSGFFHKIHSLPEKVRMLMAGMMLVAIALILFGIWSATLSSRLASVSSYPSGSSFPVPEEEKNGEAPFGPTAGILETFKSLGAVVRKEDGPGKGNNFFSTLRETSSRAFASIGRGLEKLTAYLW